MRRFFILLIAFMAVIMSAGAASGEEGGGYMARWFPGGTATLTSTSHWYTKTTTPDSTAWIVVNPKVDSYDKGRIGDWVFPDSGSVLLEASAIGVGDSALIALTADVGHKINGTWRVTKTVSLGNLIISDTIAESLPTTRSAHTGTYKTFWYELDYDECWKYHPDGVRIRGTGNAGTDSVIVREAQIRGVTRNR